MFRSTAVGDCCPQSAKVHYSPRYFAENIGSVLHANRRGGDPRLSILAVSKYLCGIVDDVFSSVDALKSVNARSERQLAAMNETL